MASDIVEFECGNFLVGNVIYYAIMYPVDKEVKMLEEDMAYFASKCPRLYPKYDLTIPPHEAEIKFCTEEVPDISDKEWISEYGKEYVFMQLFMKTATHLELLQSGNCKNIRYHGYYRNRAATILVSNLSRVILDELGVHNRHRFFMCRIIPE